MSKKSANTIAANLNNNNRETEKMLSMLKIDAWRDEEDREIHTKTRVVTLKQILIEGYLLRKDYIETCKECREEYYDEHENRRFADEWNGREYDCDKPLEEYSSEDAFYEGMCLLRDLIDEDETVDNGGKTMLYTAFIPEGETEVEFDYENELVRCKGQLCGRCIYNEETRRFNNRDMLDMITDELVSEVIEEVKNGTAESIFDDNGFIVGEVEYPDDCDEEC